LVTPKTRAKHVQQSGLSTDLRVPVLTSLDQLLFVFYKTSTLFRRPTVLGLRFQLVLHKNIPSVKIFHNVGALSFALMALSRVFKIVLLNSLIDAPLLFLFFFQFEFQRLQSRRKNRLKQVSMSRKTFCGRNLRMFVISQWPRL
jgi:hypothetical protein